MKLYFENRFGEEREIAEVETEKECFAEIKKFLANFPKFKSYYTRANLYDDYIQYDVGSHSEFFNLRGTAEEMKKAKKDWYSHEEN